MNDGILKALNRNQWFIGVNAAVFFILLNIVAARSGLRLDLTRDHNNSLTDSTQKVLARQSMPVLIEAYITRDVPGEIYADFQPVLYQLEEISRVGGDRVRVQIVDTKGDDEQARSRAERRGIQGVPIEQAKEAEASVRMGYFGVYVQVGDQSTVVELVDQGRIVDDFEYRLLRELKRMGRKSDDSGIGFLQAQGGSETRRWQRFEDQGKDNMFAFRSLLEKEMGTVADVQSGSPVPISVQTLIVTGLPHLDAKARYFIDQFIMRGGNILFMLRSFDFQLSKPDPRLMQMSFGSGGGMARVDEQELKELNAWLNSYGLELKGRILLEPALAAPELDVQGQYLVRLKNPAWAVYSRETGAFADDPLFRYTGQAVVPWFSDVAYNEKVQSDVRYRVLLHTSQDVLYREGGSLSLKDLQKVGRERSDVPAGGALPLLIEAKGVFRSAFADGDLPVKDSDKGVDAFRPGQAANSESTLLLAGTPYLVSDIFLRSEQNLQIFRLNAGFVSALIEKLQGDTDLSAARSHVPSIPTLRDPPEIVQYFLPVAWFERLFQWMHVLILPGLVAVSGVLRLLRRNRKAGLDDALLQSGTGGMAPGGASSTNEAREGEQK